MTDLHPWRADGTQTRLKLSDTSSTIGDALWAEISFFFVKVLLE